MKFLKTISNFLFEKLVLFVFFFCSFAFEMADRLRKSVICLIHGAVGAVSENKWLWK